MRTGGPSRSGYLSEEERTAAVDALTKRGRFEKGRYFAADGKTGAGQDGFEAVWEFANGRRIKYPKRRLEKPLLVNPEAFEWLHLPGFSGVRNKRLWDFGSGAPACSLYQLGAGSLLVLAGPQTSLMQPPAGGIVQLRISEISALQL